MRFSVKFIFVVLISASLYVHGQSPIIGGPALGFVTDRAGTSIWPIIGIPGASMAGDRLALEVDVRKTVISPNHQYAIGLRSKDDRVTVVNLALGTPIFASIDELQEGVDLIGISPTGSVAAVYDQDSGLVETIGHLPHAPEVLYRFDASKIPGAASGMSISDDGAIVMLRYSDENGSSVWVLTAAGASWRVPVDSPGAAALIPNSYDAIVTDNATRSAFLLIDLFHTGLRVPLATADEDAGAFSSAAASEDGRRLFLASADTGRVTIIERETRQQTQLTCSCRPSGFYQLRGTSIFRLTEPSGEAMMALDASNGRKQLVVIPANASMAAQQ